jgi:hypothetical protein
MWRKYRQWLKKNSIVNQFTPFILQLPDATRSDSMSSYPQQDESDFTLAQQVAITLAPAISGTLSILGSSCIMWMLLAENRKKLKSVKYRFLFALCVCDIINSLWFVFWSLPIPKDTPGVWGAMGNYESCNAQGFALQIGISGSFYNGALSLYFLKSVCSSMKDEQIAKRYEKWIHFVCLVWPVGTAIAAWQQDLYAFSGLGCWIASEPLRCHRRDDVDCIRGEDAYIYAWLYTGIPLILLCIFIAYSMGMIYMKVKNISHRAERWSIGMVGASISRRQASQWSDLNVSDESLQTPSQTSDAAPQRGSMVAPRRGSISSNDTRGRSRHAERTREAAMQAFLYVMAYAITHIWAFLVFNIEMGGGTNPAYLVIIENFFWPLQGFANVFIFLRPRIQSIQKSSPEMFFFTAAYHSVFYYDEVYRRSSKPSTLPARTGEGSFPTNGRGRSCSFRKPTAEGSDTNSVPAPTFGMLELLEDESRGQKEDDLQQAIQEDDPANHDADERLTVAEDTLVAQSVEPKAVVVIKSVQFDDETDNVKSEISSDGTLDP